MGEDPLMNVGEERRGRWAVSAISSPAVNGILHVDKFVCKSIEKKRKGLAYNLQAMDLHFTSFEGWSVKIWDESNLNRERVAEAKGSGVSDDDIARAVYEECMLDRGYMIESWDAIEGSMRGHLGEAGKRIFRRLALGETFPLEKDDIIKFSMRGGPSNYFDYYMEKFKLKSALNMPRAAFRFPDRNGRFEGKIDKEKVRRAKRHLTVRLKELK